MGIIEFKKVMKHGRDDRVKQNPHVYYFKCLWEDCVINFCRYLAFAVLLSPHLLTFTYARHDDTCLLQTRNMQHDDNYVNCKLYSASH